MKKHRMLIGGEWVEAASGEWFESMNPYTAKPWALIPRGGKADADRAVAAAKSAFSSNAWRGITASARGALLRRLADLLADEAATLAELETTDNGKLQDLQTRSKAGSCPPTNPASSTLRAKNLSESLPH
jgi:aldehyde dehydrogenase (NAD+)